MVTACPLCRTGRLKIRDLWLSSPLISHFLLRGPSYYSSSNWGMNSCLEFSDHVPLEENPGGPSALKGWPDGQVLDWGCSSTWGICREGQKMPRSSKERGGASGLMGWVLFFTTEHISVLSLPPPLCWHLGWAYSLSHNLLKQAKVFPFCSQGNTMSWLLLYPSIPKTSPATSPERRMETRVFKTPFRNRPGCAGDYGTDCLPSHHLSQEQAVG